MIGIVILNYDNWEDTRHCIRSICKNPPQEAYTIILIDNASGQEPGFDLQCLLEKHQIVFVRNERNVGYNAGNNVGIKIALELGCDGILISNSDVRYFPGSIQIMKDFLGLDTRIGIVGPKILDAAGRIQKSNRCRKTGMREKYLACTRLHIIFRKDWKTYFGLNRDYDQIFDVHSVLGCCFMMSRECAKTVTPFDEHPFLYEEELMLGIRMRAHGLRTVYNPQAVIIHLHGGSTGNQKAFAFAHNVRSEIYYCRQYAHAEKWQMYPLYFYRVALYMVRCALYTDFRSNWKWFLKMTAEELRQKAREDPEQEYPTVSILIRTCERPHSLRRALDSVRKQTYPNIETVIVEDGEHTLRRLLETEYQDLRYIYEATGKRVGRCRAGNLALELSSGTYLNFLDDDDILMPEHVERLVREICHGNRRAAYGVAQERQVVFDRNMPQKYRIKKKQVRYRQPFNRLLLYAINYIPIQSMLFERSLYKEMGGFDETLETLEDWDLWVRYSTVTDFAFVDRMTSCYHVPYAGKQKKERAVDLKAYMDRLHENFRFYRTEVSVEDVNREMQYIIREYKESRIVRYIRMAVRVLVLGER